jgi:ribosomal protein L14E/L6E/L27E
MESGRIVYSKMGRDKGRAYIVCRVEGEYAFLVDGGARPLTKPKKKKFKHIQPTNAVVSTAGLTDAGVRKCLMENAGR